MLVFACLIGAKIESNAALVHTTISIPDLKDTLLMSLCRASTLPEADAFSPLLQTQRKHALSFKRFWMQANNTLHTDGEWPSVCCTVQLD
jgi:hypothetical protein